MNAEMHKSLLKTNVAVQPTPPPPPLSVIAASCSPSLLMDRMLRDADLSLCREKTVLEEIVGM